MKVMYRLMVDVDYGADVRVLLNQGGWEVRGYENPMPTPRTGRAQIEILICKTFDAEAWFQVYEDARDANYRFIDVPEYAHLLIQHPTKLRDEFYAVVSIFGRWDDGALRMGSLWEDADIVTESSCSRGWANGSIAAITRGEPEFMIPMNKGGSHLYEHGAL